MMSCHSILIFIPSWTQGVSVTTRTAQQQAVYKLRHPLSMTALTVIQVKELMAEVHLVLPLERPHNTLIGRQVEALPLWSIYILHIGDRCMAALWSMSCPFIRFYVLDMSGRVNYDDTELEKRSKEHQEYLLW